MNARPENTVFAANRNALRVSAGNAFAHTAMHHTHHHTMTMSRVPRRWLL